MSKQSIDTWHELATKDLRGKDPAALTVEPRPVAASLQELVENQQMPQLVVL